MDERSARIAQRFELPILIAALLVVPVIAVEQSDVGEPWRAIAGVLNWVIWIAFAVELAVMLAVVPHRWRWLRTHPLEAVVVLLTPPFFPSSLQAVRTLRLLRLLRLLRVARYARRVLSLDGVRYAAILAALTAVGGGYAFSVIEHNTQKSPPSTWDGVWWAITTMTTVGYGDLAPTTTLGRLVAIALMLVGIGFVAILTGALAERFLAAQIEENQEILEDVEQAESDVLVELRDITERLQRLERRLGSQEA